ncbi:bifunctional 2-polyprenyl-6-hydroxyphenol methylase/3-demethylubiquinol 3-O-methyltransferase UbiG [Roseovarius sp. M141]|uniref:class I SAM-dependent methyltransferase n=1 Tax=Roseovarius sp. M141 TaxID=2583806 RepID=UPI0020CE5B3F|nr:class I SAM-dependent methyltransferase [Roseovarius sp. M141]MCQ0093894.1 class I SAM-dependent methyltransferase [Roseovarius sp. M141]
MSQVKIQYEAYPYPHRDPADEARRLVTGSPSHPLEIDHFLFGGRRDWAQPLRVLVAGGGTGDGLIQLAQMMAQLGRPADITYVDLSAASRRIAEARAQARGLKGIRFITGSLLDAPDWGPFDYIDCCGVLHHLPDPAAGFSALHAALAPEAAERGGGLGFMVYAPYGRAGVYPLQAAFGALFQGLAPEARLKAAKALVADLPAGHPFVGNPNLGDHKDSDAGFYDLLLHSQDRAFDVSDLLEVLDVSGWALSGFTMPALYDLSRIAPVPEHLDAAQQMAVAEQLRGTIKTHVAYAVPKGASRGLADGRSQALVPHLKGVQAAPLAQAIARGQKPKLNSGGIDAVLSLPKDAAPLIAAIDGRRNLTGIAQTARMDPIRMGTLWPKVHRELGDWGLLLYAAALG